MKTQKKKTNREDRSKRTATVKDKSFLTTFLDTIVVYITEEPKPHIYIYVVTEYCMAPKAGTKQVS